MSIIKLIYNFKLLSSVQLLSHVRLFVIPWTAARQASLSITNSQSLLRLMSIESVMPSNHLILCHPLLLSPSVFPSIRVFSNESALRCFSFSISPSNEYSGLISFRMDWLDLLAVQGTLKSLFEHHSSKASTLWCSAFFMVQLCDHMNRSTPGLPVHHQLPEFTQTRVHRVSDAIQPSHPLSPRSPPALNPSQHQSLFQ